MAWGRNPAHPQGNFYSHGCLQMHKDVPQPNYESYNIGVLTLKSQSFQSNMKQANLTRQVDVESIWRSNALQMNCKHLTNQTVRNTCSMFGERESMLHKTWLKNTEARKKCYLEPRGRSEIRLLNISSAKHVWLIFKWPYTFGSSWENPAWREKTRQTARQQAANIHGPPPPSQGNLSDLISPAQQGCQISVLHTVKTSSH